MAGLLIVSVWQVTAGRTDAALRLALLGLDQFTPHEHVHLGAGGAGFERVNRVWLFVLAIALHNLPEGLAVAMAFDDAGPHARLSAEPLIGEGLIPLAIESSGI